MRKLLDLFCGGGLAGRGYWESGCFSEIYGVDNNPDMKYPYPFDFVCADAHSLTYDFLLQFDFIHASPPCQFYSYSTPEWARDRHMRLIPGTHLMLKACGLPHVIENVPGSGLDLRPNLMLSGLDVGLPMNRPRLFHIADEKSASWSSSNMGSSQLSQISHVENSQMSGRADSQMSVLAATHVDEISGSHRPHLRMSGAANFKVSEVSGPNLKMSAGAHFQELYNVHGDYCTRDELIEAFGLSSLPVSHLRRLTREHMLEGIHPAMTRHISLRLFPKLMIA